jgi:very-short-patch-repair endonuclease
MTLPETILWAALRRRSPDRPAFRRQHPIGPYVLDFYCAKARLCVEVDGEWHSFGDQPAKDARRDAYLRALGIRVIRCAALDFLEDASLIVESLIRISCVRSAPSTTSWSPSPAGAGEELSG